MTEGYKKMLLIIIVLILGIIIGLSIPKVIQKQQDFERYAKAREAAEDKEEFDRNFDNMVNWFENYKRENPGATDEDAREAFDKLWENVDDTKPTATPSE